MALHASISLPFAIRQASMNLRLPAAAETSTADHAEWRTSSSATGQAAGAQAAAQQLRAAPPLGGALAQQAAGAEEAAVLCSPMLT